MESKVYTVDMSTSKTNQLRKKLAKSQKINQRLRILCFLMTVVLIALTVSFMNQQKQIAALQKKYSNIKTEYSEAIKSYTKLRIEYAELRDELKDEEMIENQSTEFEESNNIILTDSLVRYSNKSSGFKYNPEIPLSEDIQKYAYNKCQESGIDYSIFLGLMRKESAFNPSAKSGTSDYGLCQINKINHNYCKKNDNVIKNIIYRRDFL